MYGADYWRRKCLRRYFEAVPGKDVLRGSQFFWDVADTETGEDREFDDVEYTVVRAGKNDETIFVSFF